MSLSPIERYRQDLQKPGFQYDACQEQVVEHLQNLYERLLARERKVGKKRFLGVWGEVKSVDPETGLYLWGGVGRGKTYLMDTFFDSLPFDDKMRAHFHRFMRRVHQELTRYAGQKDPLKAIAEKISQESRIICFDEFFVSDITDAMLLGNLFQELFKRGVSLVATSNIVPDQLYQNGLQRERFVPAIALVKQFTKVVHVDSPTDYRLRALEKAELYHSPLDGEAEKSLQVSFNSLKPEHAEVGSDVPLEVEGRPISAKQVCEDVVWFDFFALCDGPRSQNDYIELAKEYHAVLISNIPEFTHKNNDQARRFINLIDEFYDHNVKLVISAEKPLSDMYESGSLGFEFERTTSRLLEMQSHEYLARAHKP